MREPGEKAPPGTGHWNVNLLPPSLRAWSSRSWVVSLLGPSCLHPAHPAPLALNSSTRWVGAEQEAQLLCGGREQLAFLRAAKHPEQHPTGKAQGLFSTQTNTLGASGP